MHKSLFFLFFLLFINLGIKGQIPSEKPKLVVAIVVEQMRYDYILRYWDKFEKEGFKKLINEGMNCKNARLNYLLTQGAPGIASIFTGALPGSHGIVGEEWYMRLKKEKYNCVEDDNALTIGSTSINGKKSPKWLISSSINDEMKLFSNGKSKVFSVSLNDYASILAGGKTANACYWYDDKTGYWITSSYYQDSLPKWVNTFNEKLLPEFYLQQEWNTLLPISSYTESQPDSSNYELGFGKDKFTFPYLMSEQKSKVSLKKHEIRYQLLRNIPSGNTYTLDFALATMVNEKLGNGESTDFISITFSAIDNIGHKFGPNSVEIQDAFLRLDQNMAHLLSFIDKQYGKENVLVFLTSNHGVSGIPNFLKEKKMHAGYFKYHYSVALLKSYLNALYGEGDWVSAYINQQVYLNRQLIESAKLSLEEVQKKVALFLVQYSGVANTITASDLQSNNFKGGSVFEKMQNSFHQERSGDVILNLEPGWIQDKLEAADHGSGSVYDTHVPLLWYGWKIKRGSITRRVNIEQIAASLAEFLQISYPTSCESEPIEELTK
ncbi:MAG: alkaline phosphatase family protein [Bacteroidales bacterium]|nr:alkaline phosphatase family protein [Bacteroidales bacterium]